ncbi:Oligopeptide-binding protein AppA precursor [Caloramator mitchellensis]|uniref:Oligopeptide-binding protein AppA n=1 Tax=Caloramator mitchellensis TaxID=908809 RepID=A0A0R3JUT0_CALMK|nr:peptide-binding protein [Caloramator mitchellensis]KRQ87315.1 Oligopeptide-binding protein AppA precursor [Caloramator mitchellensis]
MKKLVSLILSFLLVLTLVAPNAIAKAPAKGNEVYYATFSDPIDLNPAISSDSASSEVTGFLFRGLLTRDWDTKIIPDMAEAMPTISKDQKTITFKLKKGIKWHDGVELTSADVKFSYEFILDKRVNSPRYTDFEKIDKIETPDKYTVVFKLKEPDSALIPNFTFGYIIPKHLWENVDRTKVKQSEYNKKPIGNGPFKFVEWKPAERVVLEANPNFYGGRPKVDKIIFTITPSQAVAMVKAETGEADWVYIPESDIARMKTKQNLNVFVYDRLAFDCILYNIKSPYFSDKRVRQAISYATNKQAIVNGIYKGIGKVADGSYHPKIWAYSANVPKYNYNLAKAKQLLDQAGWKVGKDGIREKNGVKFKFVLLTNKGNIMREKLVVYIQSQLKLLGIQVEPRILEWNTFLNKYVNPRNFDAYVGGFTTALDGDQTVFYHSDPDKGYFNRGGYKNARVDYLLDEARKTFDVNLQKKYYAEVQKIVAEEQPMTFIVYRRGAQGFNKRVKNVKVVDLLGINEGYMQWTIDK